MYTILNEMGLKLLSILYYFRIMFAYQNLVLIIWKIVSYMTKEKLGIPYQKMSEKVNRFLHFKNKIATHIHD